MIPKTSSGRWLAGITAAVGALVVISLVVALATGTDDPPLLAEDTPEGTVQRYIVAFQDGDYATAYALLTEGARAQCPIEEFRRARRVRDDDDPRVRLDGTRPAGDDVEVSVSVTRFSGSPPFGVSEYTQTYHYLVTETDDGWRIVDALWPFGCPFGIERAIRLPPAHTPTPMPTPAGG